MATPSHETLSPVDAAWLRMDTPNNPMVINAIIVFKQPIRAEQWKKILEERFLRFRRFKQRVCNINNAPYWEDDPDFDLDLHVHRIGLPPPGTKKELQALVGDLMSHPIDFSRPPWQMYLVEEYSRGSALIVRLHHCIADGIALIKVLLSMADEYFDPCEVPSISRTKTELFDLLPDFLQAPAKLLASAAKATEQVIASSLKVIDDPTHLWSLARQGLDVTRTLAKLALMPPDSPTIFKGKVGPKKVAAWGQPVPLPTIKQIGKAHGAKINDVAVATVTGALRRYLIERGESPEQVTVRVVIPINLRPFDQADQLGNHFGLVFLELPLGIEDPVERLLEVKRRMDALKHSTEPIVSLGILYMLGLAPRRELQDIVVKLLSQKASAVMSNVPGPQEPLHFDGVPMDKAMFWVPQSGDVGMGLSILSYNGEILFGVMTDAQLVPDPERIATGFMEEFEMLRKQFAPAMPGATDSKKVSAKKRSSTAKRKKSASSKQSPNESS